MSELSHRKARKLIQGNHLSSHERDGLAAHLTGCEACRHYLAMHLHLSQNLQLEPVRSLPAPELKAALQQRVHNQQRRKQIMKPIQVLAGVAAVIVLIVAGWMLFNPDTPQVEPDLNSVEATAVPTEETIVVESEVPTEVSMQPAVPATDLPPTETPLPILSSTPDRMLITHPNDLIGTWHRVNPNADLGARAEDIIRFHPDGTFAVADTVADMEAGNIMLVADYWFEDGLLWTRQASIGQVYFGATNDGGGECLINGRWRKTRFEVIFQDGQTFEISAPTVSCRAQKGALSGNYARITADTVDLSIDPDNGLPINPDLFPDDEPFIVEGTLVDVDLISSDTPQLAVRLPSGETVTIVTQPNDQILDTAGTTVDLTTYEYEVAPPNPLRIRATVQKQEDGLLLSDNLTVTSLLTESPTPERILITHPNDLIGTWWRDPPATSANNVEDVYRFHPDGTFAVAETVADVEAGNIKLVADYWFEDGLFWTRQPSVGQAYWPVCNRNTSGRWRKTRFEIIVQDEQTLKFIVPSSSCQNQMQWLIGDYTRITTEPVDLHIDPDSGLAINPDPFPDDEPFIVEGTLMEVDLTSSDVPQLVMRLPSGETVIIITQPSDQILDTAGTAVDLTAYEYEVSPVNPFRIRATVQTQENGLLISDDLTVLNVE